MPTAFREPGAREKRMVPVAGFISMIIEVFLDGGELVR
jgi:hypothetical protein